MGKRPYMMQLVTGITLVCSVSPGTPSGPHDGARRDRARRHRAHDAWLDGTPHLQLRAFYSDRPIPTLNLRGGYHPNRLNESFPTMAFVSTFDVGLRRYEPFSVLPIGAPALRQPVRVRVPELRHALVRPVGHRLPARAAPRREEGPLSRTQVSDGASALSGLRPSPRRSGRSPSTTPSRQETSSRKTGRTAAIRKIQGLETVTKGFYPVFPCSLFTSIKKIKSPSTSSQGVHDSSPATSFLRLFFLRTLGDYFFYFFLFSAEKKKKIPLRTLRSSAIN